MYTAQSIATLANNAWNLIDGKDTVGIGTFAQSLAGDDNRFVRQQIMERLTDSKPPVAKCGVNVIKDTMLAKANNSKPVVDAMTKAFEVHQELKAKTPESIIIVDYGNEMYITFGKDAERISRKLMISMSENKKHPDEEHRYSIMTKHGMKEKSSKLKELGSIVVVDSVESKQGKELAGKAVKQKKAKAEKPVPETKAVLGYRIRFQHSGKLHNWLRVGDAEKAAVLENSTAILKELYPDMGKVEIREMTQIEFDLMKR